MMVLSIFPIPSSPAILLLTVVASALITQIAYSIFPIPLFQAILLPTPTIQTHILVLLKLVMVVGFSLLLERSPFPIQPFLEILLPSPMMQSLVTMEVLVLEIFTLVQVGVFQILVQLLRFLIPRFPETQPLLLLVVLEVPLLLKQLLLIIWVMVVVFSITVLLPLPILRFRAIQLIVAVVFITLMVQIFSLQTPSSPIVLMAHPYPLMITLVPVM